MTDLLPHETGYAPTKDIHGDSLTDIGAEVRQGTSVPLVPFTAYSKMDGAPVVVDARTFDGKTMTREPPPA